MSALPFFVTYTRIRFRAVLSAGRSNEAACARKTNASLWLPLDETFCCFGRSVSWLGDGHRGYVFLSLLVLALFVFIDIDADTSRCGRGLADVDRCAKMYVYARIECNMILYNEI